MSSEKHPFVQPLYEWDKCCSSKNIRLRDEDTSAPDLAETPAEKGQEIDARIRMATGFYNGWSSGLKLNFGEKDRVGATEGLEKGRRGSQDCFGPSEKPCARVKVDTGFHQVHLSYHSFPLQRYSNYRCLNYRGTPMFGQQVWGSGKRVEDTQWDAWFDDIPGAAQEVG